VQCYLLSHTRGQLTGQYEREGYVVVPDLIPPQLLDPLSLAADRVTDRARSGGWSQVRVVGKQFPPWVAGDDVWGVQNLMHPDLGEGVFAEWYGSEGMLEVSAALMGCRVEDMQFGGSTIRDVTLLLSDIWDPCCLLLDQTIHRSPVTM
jgi:hypothetical protein